jgi:hypothetical protein
VTRGIVWGLLILGIAGVVMALTAGLAAADAPNRGRGNPNVVHQVAATGHARPHASRPSIPPVVHAPPVIKAVVKRSERTAHATTDAVDRSAGDGVSNLRQVSKPTVQRANGTVRDVTGTVEDATRDVAASTVEDASQTVRSATSKVGVVVDHVTDLVDGVGEALPQADDPPGPADRSTAKPPPSTGQAPSDRRIGPADADNELPGDGHVTTVTVGVDQPTYGALDESNPTRPAPGPDIPAGTTFSSPGESRGGRCDRYGGSAVSASAHDLTAVGAGEYSHRLPLLGMVVEGSDPLGPQSGRQPGTTPD